MVFILGLISCSVALTVENYKLKKRITSVTSDLDDANALFEKTKSENEVTPKENDRPRQKSVIFQMMN